MKNIIIAGAGRAGKSTLARMIKDELNCFVINHDRLVAIFSEAYPALGIRIGYGDDSVKNIAPFVGHMLGMFSAQAGQGLFPYTQGGLEQNRFVLEGWGYDFEQILPILRLYGIEKLSDKFILIGLVQNRKTAAELVSDMRKYDTQYDWTYGFENDADLRVIAEENLAYSHYASEYLPRHGFALYDTSAERERVFAQIIKEIKANDIS